MTRVFYGRPGAKFEAARAALEVELQAKSDALVAEGKPFRYQSRIVYYKAMGRVALYHRLVQNKHRGAIKV